MFCEKLDFLMTLTGVSNSTLARVISVDPSYVSRLRRGKRTLPKNQSFLMLTSDYFSSIIEKNPDINKVFSDAVSFFSTSSEIKDLQLSQLIFEWLSSDSNSSVFNSFVLSNSSKVKNEIEESSSSLADNESVFYYGSIGKRTACIRFLSEILSQGRPTTIYLHSEESMDWFYEDPFFNMELASLLKKLLANGCKIKIIHNMNRDLNELCQALNIWLPIYLTGVIDAYYYPRLRDNIYKRTLFIAPRISAISSLSIKDNLDDTMNLYTNDINAINSLFIEFNRYLELCNPIIDKFSLKGDCTNWHRYIGMTTIEEDTIVQNIFPSIATMPDNLVEKYSAADNKNLDCMHGTIFGAFKSALKAHKYIEFISLPAINSVLANKIAVPESKVLFKNDIYYTREDFRDHISNVLDCVKEYENYILIIQDEFDINAGFISIKDHRTLIFDYSAPENALMTLEPNLSLALWEYLGINYYSTNEYDRDATVKRLEEYIEKLNKYI